jgi:hypothetical protein
VWHKLYNVFLTLSQPIYQPPVLLSSSNEYQLLGPPHLISDGPGEPS